MHMIFFLMLNDSNNFYDSQEQVIIAQLENLTEGRKQ